MTMSSAVEKCVTCYGEGTVGSDRGPARCPDCSGLGTLPSQTVLTERRLRELERICTHPGVDLSRDVEWLVTEVRRSQHALLQILAASQDADPDDTRAAQIRGLANDVLCVYAPSPIET